MTFFPNPVAFLRLASAVVIEAHHEWQVTRRYLSEISMAGLRKVIVALQSADKPLASNAKSPSIQHDSLITTREHMPIRSPLPYGTLSQFAEALAKIHGSVAHTSLITVRLPAAIDTLLQDPSRAATLGERGQQFALEEFSPRRMEIALRQVHRPRLLGKGRGPMNK